MHNINQLVSLLAAFLMGLPTSVALAAEVIGSVDVTHAGMFNSDASVLDRPISVTLFPDDKQLLGEAGGKTHRIEISGNRIAPAFMTVQLGDKIQFVNLDKVYHQLFSVSRDIPFDVVLKKSGQGEEAQSLVVFDHNGTAHIFCRIHNKSYARVDVLDTPYQQMIQTGQKFHFSGLAAGRWTLRLASPAAETRLVKVDAVTAPPPLKLQITSYGGGSGMGDLNAPLAIESMYQ